MEELGKLVRVKAAKPLEEFRVWLQFEDGSQRAVDLEPFLRGPIFEPIRRDMSLFRAVSVVDGTLAWENGADIDPDVLYYGLEPAWMEEPVTAG